MRLFLIAALVLWPLVAPAAPLPVVASFSILADLVAEVGGARVAVTSLVGPDEDAHVFQPSPQDAQAVAGARLVVANGLGFDAWVGRLHAAAQSTAPVVLASRDVTPLTGADGADGPDPHAWQSLTNARLYVRTIAAALADADPDGADTYRANADAYVARIDALDAQARTAFAALPEERRRIVTSHDAFAYLAADFGLTIKAAQGVSTESEVSAADVARLITQIRDEAIPVVFVENVSDPRLLDRIAEETGARIGGTLYSDALSGKDGPAATYIDLMAHNLSTLAQGLGG